MSLKVLISHAHDEKPLAAAWKELLESTSMGAVEVWFSSDQQAGGGIGLGTEWRSDLYQRLSESHFIIAIQTPSSAGRPWIMWEAGVASGIDKVRGIIPVVYSMGRDDLTNPLSSYQVYLGQDEDHVREICQRLIVEAGLRPVDYVFPDPLRVYSAAIALHKPRKALQADQMRLWRSRFEELIHSGRVNEVPGVRQMMYASLGEPFQPVEASTHELLSRVLLEQKDFAGAIQEADYALKLVGDDVQLLHRKALGHLGQSDLQAAQAVVDRIIATNQALQSNPEIASLEGRIHRDAGCSVTKLTQRNWKQPSRLTSGPTKRTGRSIIRASTRRSWH